MQLSTKFCMIIFLHGDFLLCLVELHNRMINDRFHYFSFFVENVEEVTFHSEGLCLCINDCLAQLNFTKESTPIVPYFVSPTKDRPSVVTEKLSMISTKTNVPSKPTNPPTKTLFESSNNVNESNNLHDSRYPSLDFVTFFLLGERGGYCFHGLTSKLLVYSGRLFH